MTFLLTLLLYGAVAVGFFLLIDGISFMWANSGDRGASRTDRRLEEISAQKRVERIESIATESRPTPASSLGQYLERLILQSNANVTPARIFGIMILIASGFFLLLYLTTPYIPIALQMLIAILVGGALPIIRLNQLVKKRSELFQEQLPDAIDLVVRSLKIGHPISAALHNISKEMSDPLGGEFAIAARQVQYGKTPPEAITGVAERVNLADMRFFSVATQIQYESGGSLAEILTGLSRIIRARFQLYRKVKALTAEGRFSAWFLSGFPVFMIFAMNVLQPGYYSKVADFEFFPHAVAITFFLLIVNVIAMRMITKLEV